ncbi:hypothetical protein DFJ77DRAFT_84486 [Powellomyces hirtus]|nr:hypothetical protein DFJ77DRAFT_84486 [Powellomyces hirtus]
MSGRCRWRDSCTLRKSGNPVEPCLHTNNLFPAILQLAGLYHYTLPGLSEIIDLYKAFCPRPIKAVVRTSSTLAVRTASAVLSPVMSGASYVLGMNGSKSIPATQPSSNGKATDTPSSTDASASNSDANEHGPTPSQMEAASLIPPPPPRPPLLHYTQQFVTHLKRQPIPVKTGLNIMLFLRQFVPERIEKALMNALYPSPWVANSVEDPWGLMKASVESPSVGVYLSIAQMAIHHEYYNNWVASSSVHRAEVASDDSQQGPPDAARTASANSTSSDGSNTSTSTSKRKANQDLSEEESWNELTTYLRKFESLEKLPLFFCYANADGVIRMKDSLVGYERSGSFWKDVIHYEDEVLDAQVSDSAKATASGSGSGSGSRKAANEEADGKLRGKIVEGVKESFEDCVKVLRTGSDNVGSRTPSLQKTGNPMEDISFITHAQDTNLAVPTLTGTHHHHGSPASYSGTEDNDEFLQSLHDDATKKVRFSPLIDDADAAGSILWAPRKSFSSTSLYTLPKRSHQHHPRPPPRTKFTSAVKAAAEATAADSSSSSQAHRFSAHLPATSSTAEDTAATAAGEGTSSQQQPFKPAFPAVFSLDAGTSYGHIDVLGGVHAEVLWVCIAEWLEKTTSRNRQWGFWRRYSAK